MINYFRFLIVSLFLILLSCNSAAPSNQESANEKATTKMKALILDGENNHGVWPMTTMMMKDYLEQTGLFEVEIERTAFIYQGPHHDVKDLKDIKELLTMYPLSADQKGTSVEKPTPDPNFNPTFSDYDVVLSNMGWQSSNWSDKTKGNFEKYMADGGGLIVVHAANNAWGDWKAFNKMIGIGGWGGRNEESGANAFYDATNKPQKVEPAKGECGSHGPQQEFILETRAPSHPIMNGLPTKWLHTKDELYDRLCGPAENMTILATAYSDVETNGAPWIEGAKGSGRHEPALMAIKYGKGRIFHTILGHMDYSMECVGFITTLQRGAEWAATGKVTQEVPKDFPTEDAVSSREWK